MITSQQTLQLGEYQDRVSQGLQALAGEDFVRRFREKDASLWKSDPQAQAAIRNRLGWMDIPVKMRDLAPEILRFVDEARAAGFTQALLMGMGGSSLCPEVCRLTFGVRPGYLDLAVLDSTDPGMVLARERKLDLDKTLFLVCSKSGTTAEINAFYHYFWDKVKQRKGDRAGESFIAITDPGTALQKEAEDRHFRRVFTNPPDIGGRYSALSYFGLVPAALIGVDIKQLLDRAGELLQVAESDAPIEERPGIVLGNAIGQLALAGRDKLTFALSNPIASFGDWVEQLIAESTGKEGKGIVPVVGEPIGPPEAYSDDRAFVYLELFPGDNPDLSNEMYALEMAGHPVIRIQLRDPLDVGREFLRWEIATAVAGAALGVNPFDEPNVKESKDNTNAMLKEFQEKGRLPEDQPVLTEEGISLYCDPETASKLAPSGTQALTPYLAAFLSQLRPGEDYLALMAFIPNLGNARAELQSIRLSVRDATKAATTVGFGPRFLHSTGQLHKGGPNTGVFIQITHTPPEKLPIPGEPFDFGTMIAAQALGDFRSLRSHDRRAIRLHLGGDVDAGLKKLRALIDGIVRH